MLYYCIVLSLPVQLGVTLKYLLVHPLLILLLVLTILSNFLFLYYTWIVFNSDLLFLF